METSAPPFEFESKILLSDIFLKYIFDVIIQSVYFARMVERIESIRYLLYFMKLEYLAVGKKCKILTGCFIKVIMDTMRHNYNRKSL